MPQSHIISALTAKHSQLQGQITHQKELIKMLTNELETIGKTILIFEPNFKLNEIKSKSVRAISYFKRGELTREILECLKNKPSTIDEISDYLFANSTADSHFIAKFRQNIHCTLNKLKQRNIIKQDQHTYEII
ncbi:hypothetical protein [Campylobacter sp. RM9328]|uniref:hypothetical protein n=1 Tax=Campylobacter sp. RM9328 TaxID=1705720 RepID=UPI001472A49B|nr:hypothetical protein [Campylobacter sp. RM9328]